LRLGRAEAAERTAGHVVGVDRAAVERNVGDLVAATGEQRGDLDHFDAGRGIGAAIGDDLGLDGGDLTVPRDRPTAAETHGMSLVMADD